MSEEDVKLKVAILFPAKEHQASELIPLFYPLYGEKENWEFHLFVPEMLATLWKDSFKDCFIRSSSFLSVLGP